ncbi:MAG: phosphoglucosamine mutase [Firmicutes bacterium]|jgi:phosphoglucosamine mutase|nr:phosphoglucosamine mutase [Bacillota bacterium]
MGTLFGTDGVRDVANGRLTPELAFKLGRAGAASIRGRGRKPAVVIGSDTRLSSGMLEAAVVAGVTSAGADALRAGVIPTPAVAHLTVALGADAGVVISASHNPAEYNGVKFFGPDGFKLADETEAEIESRVLSTEFGCADDGLPRPTGAEIGSVTQIEDAAGRYVAFAIGTAKVRLDGLRVVVDCANGASCKTTPQAFRALGAEVVVMNDSPDGWNINRGCGSIHPEALARAVREHGADLGFAHDGDADRVIAADACGDTIDGDQIMAVCAKHMAQTGRLAGRAIVATPYSNLGLTQAMRDLGCDVVIAQAGDRYVLEEMRKRGLALGGEQSGHVIFLDRASTGDGLITALELSSIVVSEGKPLHELAKIMVRYPQVMVNVRVSRKDEYHGNEPIEAALRHARETLGDTGRIVVRPSGTEPLVRVMGEARDREVVERVVNEVAEVIRCELG